MTPWFHSAIIATSVAATLAVGIASAAIISDVRQDAAPKADRLPVVADARAYVTVEKRQDGVSTLERIPLD